MTPDPKTPRPDPEKLLDAVAAGAAQPTPELDVTDLGSIAERLPAYEFLACVGRGGMGTVYEARDRRLGRAVAVKILLEQFAADPSFAERFEREAVALAQLNHPNILTIYEFGESDGLFYIVTEFVDGVNLRQLLEMDRLPAEEGLRILPQICDALQFAHDHGVVHRDIKPENILVDESGRVRIADFGLAKIVNAGGSAPALTRSQQVFGTPNYMAPEQMRGADSVDHRADIFSLGVLTYEMLTGTLPVGLFGKPSTSVDVDPKIDAAVLRSLESEPERRYQQVAEFQRDLERDFDPAGEPVRTAPSASMCWLPIKALGWVAAAFVVWTVTALVYFQLYENSSEQAWLLFVAGGLLIVSFVGYTVAGAVAIHRIRKARGKLTGLGLAVLAAWGPPLAALDSAVLANLWNPSEVRTGYPVLLVASVAILNFALLAWQYQLHSAAAFQTIPWWRRQHRDPGAAIAGWSIAVVAVGAALLFCLSVIEDENAALIARVVTLPIVLAAGGWFLGWRWRTMSRPAGSPE